jgi:hypothetical protein
MTYKSFLGIPVTGEIKETGKRAKQLPQYVFEPLVQALIDDPEIVEFGWTQYTPYFNDGEPCIFGANSLWVRTTKDAPKKSKDDDDYDEDELEHLMVEYGHPSLGAIEWEWVNDPVTNKRTRSETKFTGPDRERYDRCMLLANALCSAKFDDVLLSLFGDHAEITVNTNGITIDTYEHD